MRAKSLPRENSYTVRNLRGRIYNSPPLLKIRPPYKKIAPPIKNSPLSQCTCFEVGDFYHVEILPDLGRTFIACTNRSKMKYKHTNRLNKSIESLFFF